MNKVKVDNRHDNSIDIADTMNNISSLLMVSVDSRLKTSPLTVFNYKTQINMTITRTHYMGQIVKDSIKLISAYDYRGEKLVQ